MTDEPISLPPAPLDRATLMALLDEMGIATVTHDHPAVFTVAESNEVHDMMPEVLRTGSHTKNLFLKDKKNKLFLVTAHQDTAVDLKRLHKVLGGSSRFSFANADLLMQHLGVAPGSVSAFCVANDRENAVRFVLDEKLRQRERINCHPLTNEATTSIAMSDLVAFARACGHEPDFADLSGTALESGATLESGAEPEA